MSCRSEYETPQPGERDSLDLLYARAEAVRDEIEAEAILHVEMYPDDGFVNDLLGRLAHVRQGFQLAERAVEDRWMELL